MIYWNLGWLPWYHDHIMLCQLCWYAKMKYWYDWGSAYPNISSANIKAWRIIEAKSRVEHISCHDIGMLHEVIIKQSIKFSICVTTQRNALEQPSSVFGRLGVLPRCSPVYITAIILMWWLVHYSDVIMSPTASQIISVPIVCSAVCSGANQRKCQSPASLAFVRGIHRSPVNSPYKDPVTR